MLNEDNPFGRLYRLNFDPNDPTGGARPKLTLELDPGGWEFSGVVDAEEYLGRGAWILDVQAHSLRIAPEDTTVEGGQYLQVIWKPPSGATTARTR